MIPGGLAEDMEELVEDLEELVEAEDPPEDLEDQAERREDGTVVGQLVVEAVADQEGQELAPSMFETLILAMKKSL